MAHKKSRMSGQSQTPERLRRKLELRRSNASGTIEKKTTRGTAKRRAIEENS